MLDKRDSDGCAKSLPDEGWRVPAILCGRADLKATFS